MTGGARRGGPARLAYTALLWLLLPLIVLRLLWRARRQSEYLLHWGERFGRYSQRPVRPVLWLHAVSVGEVRAAAPLVESLLRDKPGCQIVLTCMTPTGRSTALSLFGSTALVAYLPYDYPRALRAFLRHFRPRVGLVMETEVWPNLVAECARAAVPLALVNARLSERSLRGYLRFRGLAGPAYEGFAAVAAQTASDAGRIGRLRAAPAAVTGNLKFDVTPSASLVELGGRWKREAGARRVFLAASTREGEEALLLPVFAALARAGHLCVVVPRHPQRFDEVAGLLASAGLPVARRSEGAGPAARALWLGDSMGEMAAFFTLADCAYVGGSLLPFGGQNLIEAAACGCPVLVGPHTWNFGEAADGAVAAGAALRVADAAGLGEAALRLLSAEGEAERSAMVSACREFAAAHRGATARTLELVAPLLART